MELTKFQANVAASMIAEHERRYDNLAHMIGINILKALVPATQAEIRAAMAAGDVALNTISRSRWDAQDSKVRKYAYGADIRNLSINNTTSLLKHVARNYIAKGE